jgi:hypothetical protein
VGPKYGAHKIAVTPATFKLSSTVTSFRQFMKKARPNINGNAMNATPKNGR